MAKTEEAKDMYTVDRDSTLAYKEHGDFFEKFFDARSRYFDLWARSYFEPEHAKEAFILLMKCVNWTTSQIENHITLDEINKKKEEILKEFAGNKIVAALDLMGEVMAEISSYQQEVEILPKVNYREITEEEKFWMDEEHAGLKEFKKGFMDVLSMKNG